MLLFGHVGITLLAGVVLDRFIMGNHPLSRKSKFQISSQIVSTQDSSLENSPASISSPKRHLDYRFLLIGSILPDLLDKPIGGILFYETFQNGRIFAHTLCFVICLVLLGVVVYTRWKKPWFLILSFASVIHLILDRMWLDYHTLLWPLFGWHFPMVNSPDFFLWLREISNTLTAKPSVYIPELTGLAVLVLVILILVWTRKVYAFITKGLIE
jgi:inner membrane protein